MDTLLIDPYPRAVRAGTGGSVADRAGHRDREAWPEFEIAAIDETEFFARFWAPGTDLPFDATAFQRARRAGYAWVPGMRDLLDDLEGRADRYIVSNYPVWIEELRARFALDARVEGVLASHHLGVRKPVRAFYERVLEQVDLQPAEALFVDDREANCEAAREIGIAAHRFEGVDDLRSRLVHEGVLSE
ncbi:haloacid dehalogenase [Egibacter rhizosphaerae]|uniref:Haloacid dehalogenase n=2 Tax=Egibacter rhizosphaerae TaxID=1670831 RepID=A0A411YL29_9ACTN|nr:haloacid dehalogenase [Egibacter rhizosphaerae]